MQKLIPPGSMEWFILTASRSKKIKYNSRKLNKFINETAEHFKKDKWPLNVETLACEFIESLTGVDFLSYLASRLEKKGVKVGIGSDNVGLVLYVNKSKPAKKKKKR